MVEYAALDAVSTRIIYEKLRQVSQASYQRVPACLPQRLDAHLDRMLAQGCYSSAGNDVPIATTTSQNSLVCEGSNSTAIATSGRDESPQVSGSAADNPPSSGAQCRGDPRGIEGSHVCGIRGALLTGMSDMQISQPPGQASPRRSPAISYHPCTEQGQSGPSADTRPVHAVYASLGAASRTSETAQQQVRQRGGPARERTSKVSKCGGGPDAPCDVTLGADSGTSKLDTAGSFANEAALTQPGDELDGSGAFAIDFAKAQREAERTSPSPARIKPVSALRRGPATNAGVCRFYQRGRCRYGNTCRFRHVRDERVARTQAGIAGGSGRYGRDSSQCVVDDTPPWQPAVHTEMGPDAQQRPDPRRMPVELYMRAEARALEAFQAGPAPPQVSLADVHSDAGGGLPVAYPAGSVWDAVERYFGSVEQVVHSKGAEWACTWGIDEMKQTPEYAELLLHFGGGEA
jgi:CCCH-type zinc finger